MPLSSAVEHFHGKEGVPGSILGGGSNNIPPFLVERMELVPFLVDSSVGIRTGEVLRKEDSSP